MPSNPVFSGEPTDLGSASDRSSSAFKKALKHVPVPRSLMEGVHVLRVNVNGTMRESFLTLSPDKFTLYITSGKVVSGVSKSSGLFGLKGLFVSRTQLQTDTTTGVSSASSISNNALDAANPEERSIDIGAIDRIQRGQITHKFELAK